MAEVSVGTSVNSTTERISNSAKFSRQTTLAAKSSSITKPTTMGASAAVVTGSPRGILKQTNVGDVNSSVDTVSRETQKSASATRQKVDEAAQKFSQQLTDKGSELTKTS